MSIRRPAEQLTVYDFFSPLQKSFSNDNNLSRVILDEGIALRANPSWYVQFAMPIKKQLAIVQPFFKHIAS